MEVVLKKMGNSTALILSPTVLCDPGLAASHVLTQEATSDRRIIRTPKSRHTLADMIAQCDVSAPPPADMADWEWMKPEGGEAW